MKIKDSMKEEQSPYFSKQKVKKLIADIEQFERDVNGDASVKRYASTASQNAIKTSKLFLSSLNTLLGIL